jgi:DNA invertase Pin-like site-specific DNA recombinase
MARPRKKPTPKAERASRPPRVIGYLRASTQEQDPEKDKADILNLANDKALPAAVEWCEEKVTEVKDWRKRKLGEVIAELRAGDAILTPQVSRLGRSTLQILEVMQECTKREIGVHAVKGGWSLNGSMDSKIVLTMFALFAEIERDLISERTKEGMRAAKAKGRLIGRPKGPGRSKLDPDKDRILELLRLGVPKTTVASQFDTTPANLHIWLRKRGIDPTAPKDRYTLEEARQFWADRGMPDIRITKWGSSDGRCWWLNNENGERLQREEDA